MNCAGLRTHFEDIKTDDKLLKADIMHLIEASMMEEENDAEFALAISKLENNRAAAAARQLAGDVRVSLFQLQSSLISFRDFWSKYNYDTHMYTYPVYFPQPKYDLNILSVCFPY